MIKSKIFSNRQVDSRRLGEQRTFRKLTNSQAVGEEVGSSCVIGRNREPRNMKRLGMCSIERMGDCYSQDDFTLVYKQEYLVLNGLRAPMLFVLLLVHITWHLDSAFWTMMGRAR
jgi:hypothetical protein